MTPAGRHRADRPNDEPEEPRVVVRDRRRIDPETGQLRRPADAPAPGTPSGAGSAVGGPVPADGSAPVGGVGDAADAAATQLAERTTDLQRVTAEYANYRKRIERDRTAVAETATGSLLAAMLPVLDDIDRAREHGDLSGAFKLVADQLTAALTRLGLATFGAIGEPFDPKLHEAVMHSLSAEVGEPTCVQILRRGYRAGDRLLRPAMVAVAEPSGEAPAGTAEPSGEAPADAGSTAGATAYRADRFEDDHK